MLTGGRNLYSTKQRHAPTRKQLRSFGLILAGGFLLISLWPVVFRHGSPRMWGLIFGVFFGVAGILVPSALRIPHRIWMKLGDWLGWINSKIILSVLYFVLLTPVRLVMKLMGHDSMNRKFDQKTTSYRVTRRARPASHIMHQF